MQQSSVWSTSRLFFVLGGGIAGGVHAIASSASPYIENWSAWLSLLALLLLALLVQRAKTFGQAFLAGWMFALAWLLGSVWWLFLSMHAYGGMHPALAISAVFLFCLGLGLIYAFAMGLARKLSPAGTLCTVSFAVFWMLAEMLRGYIFTGFPWAASGYAHVDGALAAYAPWLGIYGVSGVAALIAAALALLLQYGYEWGKARQGKEEQGKAGHNEAQRVLKPVHAVVGSVMIAAALGATWTVWPVKRDFTESAGFVKVALLQGNVEQSIKFDPDVAIASTQWYLDAMHESKQQGAQLAVLPETAIPFLLEYMPESMQAEFYSLFFDGEFAALVGAPAFGEQDMLTNTVFGFAPDEPLYRYDKYHLVPFGEFVPPGFRWFVEQMEIPLGDMERGAVDASSFVWAGQRIAPNICYEDLFGEELARRFSVAETAPTVMANASNIAWFGETVAIPQHLQAARMRALEFQRPMIRATNTGATAVIDHQGVVIGLLPSYTQGVLMRDVQGRNGLTPYAWWSGRFGLVPLLIASIMALAFARFMQKKLG